MPRCAPCPPRLGVDWRAGNASRHLQEKQRLEQLFFGDGVAFDGKQFVQTAVTANAFKYLTAAESSQNDVASLMLASWNYVTSWLRQVDALRQAA